MTSNNSDSDKLDSLNLLKDEAFKSKPIDNTKIQKIELELKQIPNEDKHSYQEFVNQYVHLCFINDISCDIDLNDFTVYSSEKEKEKIIEEIKSDKIDLNYSITSFNQILDKLITNLKDYFESYKGYYITKLENNPAGEFKIIFIYDGTFFIRPLMNKINSLFDGSIFVELNKFDINDISDNENYLCVFLLLTRMNDDEKLENDIKLIKNIIDNFQTFENYSLIIKNDDISYKSSNVREDFIDDLRIVLSKYISNLKLSFEEEKIIKKLCSSAVETPLYFYNILSGGFSGSKVLEVRPKKSINYSDEKKYIIKFGLREEAKLKEEIANFKKFVSGYKGFQGIRDYEAHYMSTLIYEGIIYNFAISDTSLKSFSYSDIISEKCDGLIFKNEDIIKNLFELEIYHLWRTDHQQKSDKNVENYYQEYINSKTIFNKLERILNKTSLEIEESTLYKNFNKIWKYKLNCYEKVCHGDLHTENFFIDDLKNITLIDFGYTNLRHAIIDSTSLECSLKFKHIPKYIPIEELIKIEEELLSNNSFQLSYKFSNNRKDIHDLLETINNIRYHSCIDFLNPTNFIEYYISLFLMTIRQIQYKDMNQLYAYHSACLLGEKIVNELGI
ncbi:MAG: hypothetical protein GZ091_14155 [Paludibacter sp.]|nr:hypothetical protein [Paludibacter sp.]